MGWYGKTEKPDADESQEEKVDRAAEVSPDIEGLVVQPPKTPETGRDAEVVPVAGFDVRNSFRKRNLSGSHGWGLAAAVE